MSDDVSDTTEQPQSHTTLSPDRIRRILPEVQSIRGSMRSEVVRVLTEDVPPYFWMVRASESHHCADEQGLGGLVLHTKRVFTSYSILERTYRAMAIDSFEANCARAAVLLHDGFKYGRACSGDFGDDDDYHEYADGSLSHLPEHTVTDHDIQMAEHVRSNTSLPDEVARCIESHGGSPDWYSHDGPKPSDDLEMLVHSADVFAANELFRVPVHGVSPELRAMVGDVPEIEDDSFLEWE